MDDVYGGTNRYFKFASCSVPLGCSLLLTLCVFPFSSNFFSKVAAQKMGLKVSLVDLTDGEKLKAALTKETKVLRLLQILSNFFFFFLSSFPPSLAFVLAQMVWVETPTNPMLKISDIKAIASAAHEYNKDIIVLVDNTFATPYCMFRSPLL
jgi:cystathionine beta-lyase/cystathionine gamma-synthase